MHNTQKMVERGFCKVGGQWWGGVRPCGIPCALNPHPIFHVAGYFFEMFVKATFESIMTPRYLNDFTISTFLPASENYGRVFFL